MRAAADIYELIRQKRAHALLEHGDVQTLVQLRYVGSLNPQPFFQRGVPSVLTTVLERCRAGASRSFAQSFTEWTYLRSSVQGRDRGASEPYIRAQPHPTTFTIMLLECGEVTPRSKNHKHYTKANGYHSHSYRYLPIPAHYVGRACGTFHHSRLLSYSSS